VKTIIFAGRRFLKSILLNFGYRLVRYDYFWIDYLEKLEQVKFNWVKQLNINTIIDVGASDGGFAKKIRAHFPDTCMYCFEPIPESFDSLNKQFLNDKNFVSFNLACSDSEGEINFNKHISPGTSSMLEMADLHKNAYPGSAPYETIRVKTVLLDNALKEYQLKENILLKIDVQGAELKVLSGATNMLHRTKLIFTEVNFGEMYKGNALITDITDFLKPYGFRLQGIENVSQNLADGSFLQADAWFIKD
jgi:FkbM family methyltransferase